MYEACKTETNALTRLVLGSNLETGWGNGESPAFVRV